MPRVVVVPSLCEHVDLDTLIFRARRNLLPVGYVLTRLLNKNGHMSGRNFNSTHRISHERADDSDDPECNKARQTQQSGHWSMLVGGCRHIAPQMDRFVKLDLLAFVVYSVGV